MDAIALYHAERAKRGRPVIGGGTLAHRDAQMAARHRQGATVRAIAAEFQVSQQTVCRALRRRGVKFNQRRGDIGPKRPRDRTRLTLRQQIRVLERQVTYWRKRAEAVAA